MGLRVATLVNLSFLGMDKLEQRLARSLAPAATSRCIPEAVKRFTTWGPLLIPFYIPRGKDWDRAWSTAEAIRGREPGGLLPALLALPAPREAAPAGRLDPRGHGRSSRPSRRLRNRLRGKDPVREVARRPRL